jgi:hypothetical protein
VAKDSFDLQDVLLRLGEGLQESVHAPNLYNYKSFMRCRTRLAYTLAVTVQANL